MTMRRGGAAGLAACVACAIAAGAAEEPRPDAAGVRRQEGPGWMRLEVDVPGSLVAFTPTANADGSRSIVLLVGPREPLRPPAGSGERETLPACPPSPADEGPRFSVYRWDPARPDQLRLLRDDIPGDAREVLTLDLDGDRDEESLVARPGELLLVSAEARRVVLESPALLRGGPQLLSGLSLGRLQLFGPPAHGSGLAELAQVELPRRAAVHGSRWLVETRAPVFGTTEGTAERTTS